MLRKGYSTTNGEEVEVSIATNIIKYLSRAFLEDYTTARNFFSIFLSIISFEIISYTSTEIILKHSLRKQKYERK